MASIIKVDTIQTAAGGTPTAAGLGITVTEGITVAEQWLLTSNLSLGSASLTLITSNLARSTNAGSVNAGITESSGVFSFPSTGIWMVQARMNVQKDGDTRAAELIMQVSTDGGSNYTERARGQTFITRNNSANTTSGAALDFLLDVTDTSNVRVRFGVDITNATVTVRGSSSGSETSFIFTRIGNT